MIRQIAFLYIIFLGIGFFTAGILLLFILRRPNKSKLLFFVFYISYAFLCLADSMEMLFYHLFDCHHIPSIIVLIITNLPPFIMIWALSQLLHRLLNVPSIAKKNRVLEFILLFLLVFDVAEDIWPRVSESFVLINGIEGWGIMVILLYFIILFKRYPAEDEQLKNIIGKLPFITTYTIIIIFIQLIPIINTKAIPLNGVHFVINTIIILIYSFKFFGKLLKPYFKPDEIFYREKNLTQKEKELLLLLLKGQNYNEIAANMMISINTVRTHIKNLYSKTGVNSRYSLLAQFHH